jgi:hypothetical protein
MFSFKPERRHRHAAGLTGVPGLGPPAGGPMGGTQPKGRTPIQAPWAQNAKPVHNNTPTATVTAVGSARPDG